MFSSPKDDKKLMNILPIDCLKCTTSFLDMHSAIVFRELVNIFLISRISIQELKY